MKKKTVWIIGAIIVLGVLAVIFVLARAYGPILVEGTITDDQGNAMHGVTAYVTFSRRRAEDHYSGLKSFEETVDSSFHFEGRGDGIVVIFARKGYAPGLLPLLGPDDSGELIRRDLHIVMKKVTPEEAAESIFREIDSWTYNDIIVHYEGEKWPTTEDQLENLRKRYGLEKSDMTDIFMKAIRDYLSELETKSEDSTLRGRYIYAMIYLPYYQPPQQEFLELIRRTSEVEPKFALDGLKAAYNKAYPDTEPPDAK